jgi:hypothetical protein
MLWVPLAAACMLVGGNVKDTIVCFTCNFVNDFTSLLCSFAFCRLSGLLLNALGEEAKARLILSVVLRYGVIIDCLTTTASRWIRIVERFEAPKRFNLWDFNRHSIMFIELPRDTIDVDVCSTQIGFIMEKFCSFCINFSWKIKRRLLWKHVVFEFFFLVSANVKSQFRTELNRQNVSKWNKIEWRNKCNVKSKKSCWNW